MTDKSPKDIERMVKKAKEADRNADKAKRVVDEAKAHRRTEQWDSDEKD